MRLLERLLETAGKPSASRFQTPLVSDLVCTTGFTNEGTEPAVRLSHVRAGCLIMARVFGPFLKLRSKVRNLGAEAGTCRVGCRWHLCDRIPGPPLQLKLF